MYVARVLGHVVRAVTGEGQAEQASISLEIFVDSGHVLFQLRLYAEGNAAFFARERSYLQMEVTHVFLQILFRLEDAVAAGVSAGHAGRRFGRFLVEVKLPPMILHFLAALEADLAVETGGSPSLAVRRSFQGAEASALDLLRGKGRRVLVVQQLALAPVLTTHVRLEEKESLVHVAADRADFVLEFGVDSSNVLAQILKGLPAQAAHLSGAESVDPLVFLQIFHGDKTASASGARHVGVLQIVFFRAMNFQRHFGTKSRLFGESDTAEVAGHGGLLRLSGRPGHGVAAGSSRLFVPIKGILGRGSYKDFPANVAFGRYSSVAPPVEPLLLLRHFSDETVLVLFVASQRQLGMFILKPLPAHVTFGN